MSGQWADVQPRYVAYCIAHGAQSKDEMLARDRERWPGGVMAGFILWIKDMWDQWGMERGSHPSIKTEQHHVEFDVWLAEHVAAIRRAEGGE